jgi:hypothetical protein
MKVVDMRNEKLCHGQSSKRMSQGMKWAYFENRSTITKMQFFPPDNDSPSTKSIEMLCQAVVGIGRG